MFYILTITHTDNEQQIIVDTNGNIIDENDPAFIEWVAMGNTPTPKQRTFNFPVSSYSAFVPNALEG